MAMATYRGQACSCARLAPLSVFQFRPLALAVQATLLGLWAVSAQAQTQSDSSDTQDKARGITLGTVTVSAERERPTLGTVTTIDNAALERQGATSMADAIRNMPLVNAPAAVTGASNIWDGSGTTGYNIRGVEGNRIGLDVDGIELPAAAPQPDAGSSYGTGIGRDYIDPEVFRQIRVSSGTPSAGSSEGSGLGGRVSFATKTPEDYLRGGKDRYIGLKLGYTSADRAWAKALTGAARFADVQALAVYSRRDGHETKNYGDTATTTTNDWRSNALLTRFVWTPNSSNKLGLTLDLYDRKDEKNASTSTYASYPYGAEQTSRTQRDRISLDHEFTPGGDFALFDHLRTSLYYQYSKKTDNTVALNSAATYTRHINTGLYTKTTGLNSEATKRLDDNNTLHYGVNLSWTNERRPWVEHRYLVSTGASSNGYPVSTDRMANTDTTRLALYARDEFRFDLGGREAILTPGIRGEYIRTSPNDLSRYLAASGIANQVVKSDSTSFIAPTLNFTYALTPTLDAYAQYSRGVRVPTAAEKTGVFENVTNFYSYGIIGNPDLKNETSNALELGIKGQAARGVTLNASAFYTRYKNFIDWLSVPTTHYSLLEYRMENIAKATIYGGEVSAKLDLGAYVPAARGYSATVAAGLTHGESKDNDGNKGGINSVAPAKGSLILAYDDPGQRFGVNFTSTFVKARQAKNDDVTRGSNTESNTYYPVPGYAKFDLGGYWNVRKNLTVNFAVNNITDKKYWDYATVRMFTASGRSPQAALFNRSTQSGRNYAVSATLSF